MIDFELLITVFVIVLNFLLINYTLKNKEKQISESNKCDKIVDKCTNLPIYFVKFTIFLFIALFILLAIFFIELFNKNNSYVIIDFSLHCFTYHLLSYFICNIKSKNYNFIKCQIFYILIIPFGYIFNYIINFF